MPWLVSALLELLRPAEVNNVTGMLSSFDEFNVDLLRFGLYPPDAVDVLFWLVLAELECNCLWSIR